MRMPGSIGLPVLPCQAQASDCPGRRRGVRTDGRAGERSGEAGAQEPDPDDAAHTVRQPFPDAGEDMARRASQALWISRIAGLCGLWLKAGDSVSRGVDVTSAASVGT